MTKKDFIRLCAPGTKIKYRGIFRGVKQDIILMKQPANALIKKKRPYWVWFGYSKTIPMSAVMKLTNYEIVK